MTVMKQESFEINSKFQEVIRQDRIQTNNANVFIKINDQSFEVSDYSATGLAILGDGSFKFSEKEENAILIVDNIELSRFKVAKVREEKLPSGLQKLGLDIRPSQ